MIYSRLKTGSIRDTTDLFLHLDTGKVSRIFAPGSIGELNGFNNISTQDNSVEDVLQVLRDKYSGIEIKNNKTD